MDRAVKINQAYSVTPWRKQLRIIGLFLVVLVVFALIAGIYLNVNATAATIGRQIQNHRNRIDELNMDIADQSSKLAMLTSAAVMEQRANDMGFRHIESEELIYIVVDGYPGREPAVLANTTKSFTPLQSQPKISSAYTQSLLDWVRQEFRLPPDIQQGIQP